MREVRNPGSTASARPRRMQSINAPLSNKMKSDVAVTGTPDRDAASMNHAVIPSDKVLNRASSEKNTARMRRKPLGIVANRG